VERRRHAGLAADDVAVHRGTGCLLLFGIKSRRLGCMTTRALAVRAWPHDDLDFAAFVAELLEPLGDPPTQDEMDACLVRLRLVYPRVRIVAQSRLARFGQATAYYAYRDGGPLARPSDGLGAMRYRTRVEEALLRSVELRVTSGAVRAAIRFNVLAAVRAIIRAEGSGA
jgi:hypothetical protein